MAKKRLLIIEDETSVAKQIKWGLGEEYEITIASEADQARSLLATGAFPVVTLDLGLPPYPDTPQEGFKLLEEIASLSPKTRVIVITGNAEEENAVKEGKFRSEHTSSVVNKNQSIFFAPLGGFISVA